MVLLGADPASQLGDQLVIRGVMAALSIVQEQRTQRPRSVLPAHHRIQLAYQTGETISGHRQPRLVRMEPGERGSRRIVLALGRPYRAHQSPPGASSSTRSSSGRKLITRSSAKRT